MILSGSSSTIDFSRMEFIPECNREFPVACYKYDLFDRIEPWHWHDQFEIALIEGDPHYLDNDIKRYPLGYFGEPDDVAYAVLFLASDEGRFVTGTKLVIDGGYTAQ